MITTGSPVLPAGQRRRGALLDEIWDDPADQDANQLVALLFVAASPLRRVEVAETLRISPARLAPRACTVLRADPPRGLRLEESGDQLGLVSAPECTAVVERHLGQPELEPLSQAALKTLSTVAYEQPVTARTYAANVAWTVTRLSKVLCYAGWSPMTQCRSVLWAITSEAGATAPRPLHDDSS